MAKDDKVLATEGEAPLSPAPASKFRLVGLDPDAKRVHVSRIDRDFLIEELKKNESTLEMLHRLEWPHVEKV